MVLNTYNANVAEEADHASTADHAETADNWGGELAGDLNITEGDLSINSNDCQIIYLSDSGSSYARGRMDLANSDNDNRISLEAHRSYPEIRIDHEAGTIQLEADEDMSRLALGNDNDSRAVLMTRHETGGCGELFLMDSSDETTFYVNACERSVVMMNSRGEITIEFDAETGNVYYSGELNKR